MQDNVTFWHSVRLKLLELAKLLLLGNFLAHVIVILQRLVALGWGSSSLPHIIASASLSLICDNFFVLGLFFVTVDYHFVVMSPLCIGSLFDFCYYLLLLGPTSHRVKDYRI